MKYIVLILSNFFLFLSCTSIDVDKKIKDSGIGILNSGSDFIENNTTSDYNPGIEIIEKPVYIPAPETPPSRTQPGEQTVLSSNKEGIIKPNDYSHAVIIYDYHQDFVFEVFTQPLRVSDLSLQPGERIMEAPFVSDSERWILGAGVSYDNGTPIQHVYIKPTAAGLSASLIINTDRRVYRIILRSYSNIHMPSVRWRYVSGLPSTFIQPPRSANNANDTEVSSIDPRFLSFNYRITHGLFGKPYWLPELVFDDGAKTYITFPNLILQKELPTVFENRNDILNYRVSGNLIIIDKLIEDITIRINRTEISISKKRSSNVRSR